jgi:hypothetical protein
MRTGSLLVACSLLVAAAPALARTRQVAVSGNAVVVGAPRQARSQAVAVALRKAVEEVAVALGGPREGESAAADHALYERAPAFVRSSLVTNESVDGTIMTIDLQADVDADQVAQVIGATGGAHRRAAASSDSLGGKRVLVLATEQLGPHQIFGWTDIVWGPGGLATKTTAFHVDSSMGSMESTFADGFTGAGFSVVDPHVLRGHLQPRPAFQVLDLSAGEARQIAQKSDADLVVVAKGVALIGAGVGEMVSGQANVVARLIRIRDGKVLASTTQHAAQVHIDAATARLQALDAATRQAADELVKKINAN